MVICLLKVRLFRQIEEEPQRPHTNSSFDILCDKATLLENKNEVWRRIVTSMCLTIERNVWPLEIKEKSIGFH